MEDAKLELNQPMLCLEFHNFKVIDVIHLSNHSMYKTLSDTELQVYVCMQDVVDPSIEEQQFLLKPRARGKRQVKPNAVALTGELPPVFDRWAAKSQRKAGGGNGRNGNGANSSDEDELWRPPRMRAAPKRRRTQGHGSEDGGAAGSHTSPEGAVEPSAGGAGAAAAHAPGRAAGSARRGYGWQLLQQELLQQQQAEEGPISPPENGASPNAGWMAVDGTDVAPEGQYGTYSGGSGGMIEGEVADTAADAGSADAGGSEGGLGVGSADVGVRAGGKPRGGKAAPRRDRWVPPTEEWMSDDGLKVMPKVRTTEHCMHGALFFGAFS